MPSRICEHCNYENVTAANFCARCGVALIEQSDAVQAPISQTKEPSPRPRRRVGETIFVLMAAGILIIAFMFVRSGNRAARFDMELRKELHELAEDNGKIDGDFVGAMILLADACRLKSDDDVEAVVDFAKSVQEHAKDRRYWFKPKGHEISYEMGPHAVQALAEALKQAQGTIAFANQEMSIRITAMDEVHEAILPVVELLGGHRANSVNAPSRRY